LGKTIPKHKDIEKTPFKEKKLAQIGKESIALGIIKEDPSKSNLEVSREMQNKGISVNDLYVTHRIGRNRLFKMNVDEVRTHYKRILDKELMPVAIDNIKAALKDKDMPAATSYQYDQLVFKQAMDESGKDKVQPVTINIENIQAVIEGQLKRGTKPKLPGGAKNERDQGQA